MLTPLPYHISAAKYFVAKKKVWDFFSNVNNKQEQLSELKLDLLKNAYKFTEEAEPDLFTKVSIVKEKLGLFIPVFIYQAQNTADINASVIYLQNEIHIVFSGRIIQSLTDDELLAVLAHELSHVLLYTQLDGHIEIVDRLMYAIGNHLGSTPAHYESARLFRLYTEIFCDRGAYTVTGNYAPIITSLVKIATGLNTVNADSYIKQSEEIFSSDDKTKTSGISHPENFIRARAIWLWHTKGKEAELEIIKMIEGHASIDELDLFKQQQLSKLTKEIISLILQPEYMQSAHLKALADQYMSSVNDSHQPNKEKLKEEIESLHPTIKDYLAYVLFDFSTADKELEDIPLGLCFSLADELQLAEPFAKAVIREKKLTQKKVVNLKKQTIAALQNI